jgi:tetratricopeptide (TPR) repeat protein
VAELKALADERVALEHAGIDVLCLNVDELSQQSSGGAAVANQVLEQMSFPHRTGFADAASLDKLKLLMEILFDTTPRMVVPMSFLVDADGKLGIIYRGSLDVKRLPQNAVLLSADAEERRDQSVPLAGRWCRPPGQVDLRLLALPFQDRFPGEAVRFLQLALEQIGERREQGALVSSVRTQLDEKECDVHFRLAYFLRRAGQRDEALRHAQQAAERKSNDADVQLLAAELEHDLGNVARSIERYESALALAPDRIESRFQLAKLLRDEQRTDEAIEHLQKAVASAPSFAKGHFELGMIFGARGDYQRAIDSFAEVLKHVPDHVGAMVNLGAAAERLDKSAEAEAMYRRALSVDEKYAQAHHFLATLLRRRGDLQAALDHNRRYMVLRPEDARAEYELGFTLHLMGNAQDAIAHYRRALIYDSQLPQPANNLAAILATHPDPALRDGREALRLAELVVADSDRKNAAYLDTLAAAYAELGKYSEAIEIIEEALRFIDVGKHPEQANELRARLTAYRSGNPYRNEKLIPVER